jgi:Protein of unknown function (DUF3225)
MATDINRPEIVAEVRAAFDRYNAAIDSKDVATLNELFWKSDNTVRFGFGENLFGHDAIVEFRGTKWLNAPARRATRVIITTVGRDCATTSAVMERGDGVTRQSQTWVRFPEGWRIVAAHVSALRT